MISKKEKYNRVYRLVVEKRDNTFLEVQLPFTVEFDIHRNNLTSANVCSFRIYNLSPENRAQLRLDQFDPNGKKRAFMFFAGYGENISLAFHGTISQAFSVREGINMITQIENFDGGWAYINSTSENQFPTGTPLESVINTLIKNLKQYDVSRGAIGSFSGNLSRGVSVNGSTIEAISEQTQGALFIDNGKVHCLNDNECIAGDVPFINSDSGLLGTPLLENQYVHFEMLFEPGLSVGQLINLQSQTAEHFNGVHKIYSLKHRGTISASVCGDAVTSVGCLPGDFTPVREGS